jgi:hypothetical protein
VVIDVVAACDLDRAALEAAIRSDLQRSGLRAPEVTIRAVTSIAAMPIAARLCGSSLLVPEEETKR